MVIPFHHWSITNGTFTTDSILWEWEPSPQKSFKRPLKLNTVFSFIHPFFQISFSWIHLLPAKRKDAGGLLGERLGQIFKGRWIQAAPKVPKDAPKKWNFKDVWVHFSLKSYPNCSQVSLKSMGVRCINTFEDMGPASKWEECVWSCLKIPEDVYLPF